MALNSELPSILIVDDFDDALEIYRQCLTFKGGYRILTASSGADAIEIARTERPALIFMDLRMAVMSGTEAMRLLRTDSTLSHVPIIAFTAQALDEERQSALAAGFDEFIPKPCLPDEFIAAVDRLLATPRHIQPS